LRSDGRVLDREVEGSISGTKVLVKIIGVDARKGKRGGSSGSDFLIESSDFSDSGVVNLQAGDFEEVGVTAVISPVNVVGVGDKSVPVIQVKLFRDSVVSTSKDRVSNHETLEGSAKLLVGANDDQLRKRRN